MHSILCVLQTRLARRATGQPTRAITYICRAATFCGVRAPLDLQVLLRASPSRLARFYEQLAGRTYSPLFPIPARKRVLYAPDFFIDALFASLASLAVSQVVSLLRCRLPSRLHTAFRRSVARLAGLGRARLFLSTTPYLRAHGTVAFCCRLVDGGWQLVYYLELSPIDWLVDSTPTRTMSSVVTTTFFFFFFFVIFIARLPAPPFWP